VTSVVCLHTMTRFLVEPSCWGLGPLSGVSEEGSRETQTECGAQCCQPGLIPPLCSAVNQHLLCSSEPYAVLLPACSLSPLQ